MSDDWWKSADLRLLDMERQTQSSIAEISNRLSTLDERAASLGENNHELQFEIHQINRRVLRMSAMVETMFEGLMASGHLGSGATGALADKLRALEASQPEAPRPEPPMTAVGYREPAPQTTGLDEGFFGDDPDSEACVRCGSVQPKARLNLSSKGPVCATCAAEEG